MVENAQGKPPIGLATHASEGKTMKSVYRILLGVCLLVGLTLYGWSFRYPWYTVPEQELRSLAERLADKPRDIRWKEWYEGRKALETPRKALHDTGVGLAALAVTLAVFHFGAGFPLKGSRTPGKRWQFIGLYLLALALQVPASVYYLGHRQARHDYPCWGDSIGIGLFGTVFACVLFGIVGTLFFLAVLWKTRLPANLYIWSKEHSITGCVITALCVLSVAVCLVSIEAPVRDGSVGGVIMTVTLLYLFLSARAGLLGYRGSGEPTAERSLGQADPP